MKQDPFASLSGLDQRLFAEADKETRKQASTPASLSPDPQGRNPAVNQSSNTPGPQASVTADNLNGKPASGSAAPQSTRTAPPPSRALSVPRTDARHTYDIFEDQVRWMNRLKLDVEEAHNKRLTINGFVKLALDILRQDYEARGDRSHLVRVLIKGRPLEIRQASDGEGEG